MTGTIPTPRAAECTIALWVSSLRLRAQMLQQFKQRLVEAMVAITASSSVYR